MSNAATKLNLSYEPTKDDLDYCQKLISILIKKYRVSSDLIPEVRGEAYYQMMLACKNYDRSKGEFKKYLRTYVYFVIRKVLKKRYKERGQQLGEVVSLNTAIKETYINNFDHNLINEKLNRILNRDRSLSKLEREIVKLKVFDDLKFVDIANLYNEKKTWAIFKYYNGIAKLKTNSNLIKLLKGE